MSVVARRVRTREEPTDATVEEPEVASTEPAETVADTEAETEETEVTPGEEIFPPEFLRERWGTPDPARALELAEQASTSTPVSELKHCPECGTRRVYARGGRGAPREPETAYVCDARHHFDEPVYPDEDDDETDPREAHPALEPGDDTEGGSDETDDRPTDTTTPREAPTMPRHLKTVTREYSVPTGDELRAIRRALDLSTRDVRDSGPVAGSTVRRWENGRSRPRLDDLEALLAYYETVDAHNRAARLADALNDAVDEAPEDEADTDEEEADPFVWTTEEDLVDPAEADARRSGAPAGGEA